MTLLDDVKYGYETTRDEQDTGPVSIVRSDTADLAPGFGGMRSYYEQRLLANTRRGYRHCAGASLPEGADEQLEKTREVMAPLMIGSLMLAFTDGVLIGHEAEHQVKVSHHFDIVDHIFSDTDFRDTSRKMATGFADDAEVLDFFTSFFMGGIEHLSHITGFAHRPQVNQGKVWDLWMLVGTACVCSSYLAGHHMGQRWKERDVLDGITIASEEVTRGSG